LVCLFFYSLVPLSFQGFLGLAGLLDPGILSGSGVGLAMAHMVGFTGWAVNIVIIMLVATLLLSVMAAIAGSARTLYQSSKDGFLPKYLSQTNEKATPTRAMWTDLSVNVFLLMMNNDLYILALSNVAYMTFIYMNLQSGWMHRMDRPDWTRSYKAPSLLLGLGAVCGFVDMFVIGVGSNSYGKGVLIGGFTVVFLSVPIFLYRHYITDKGKFPDDFAADIQPGGTVTAATTRAGYLPYLAVAGAVAAVAIGSYIAVY
jgi:amino acid transporter